MVVGHCWQALCATVPGFAPLAEDRVILAGVRDTEPAERVRPDRSAIHRVDAGVISSLPEHLGRLQATRISLHVDLDVLDRAHGRANEFAVSPGISADELVTAARRHRKARARSLTLSAYDPDRRVRNAALACSTPSPGDTVAQDHASHARPLW
jgi:arginase